MVRRVALAEAKRSGKRAAEMGKHRLSATRSRQLVPPPVTRMPPQFSSRDVELLLEILWGMFTQSQAERLVVSVPWDESDEPRQMKLSDLAALLEGWLG